MLSRRSALTGTSALGACVTAGYSIGLPVSLRLSDTTAAFEVPRGACDSHVHVIGDPRIFPMSPGRDYSPSPATADELLAMLQLVNMSRVVVVTPAAYTDNSATIAAISQLGPDRARGVGWLPGTGSFEVLGAMKEAGIVGFRVVLHEGWVFNAAVASDRLKAKFEVAERLGWHLDVQASPEVIAALAGTLDASPVPLVVDTFGWAAGGVKQQGFDAVLALLKSGRCYVKLSEPYRLSSKYPDFPDLLLVVNALIAANADRILWGSGWPYVSGAVPGRAQTDFTPNLPMDTGRLLNVFAGWVPNAETRRKILVDNPAQLYGF